MIRSNKAETPIDGVCDPAFADVEAAFLRNFAERDEIGASVCVKIGGRTLVDLWGGHRDDSRETAWERDTVSIVFSCTKAATALCAHLLIDRGLLDLDAPIVDYWPAFGAGGKESATVRMALNHSAGAPVLRAPLKQDGFCDWDYMVQRIETEDAHWAPGAEIGYHMSTYGWIVGELIRRQSGESLGAFFRKEIAEPLEVDFWIGLPESEEPRVSPLTPFAPGPGYEMTDFAKALVSDSTSRQFLALMNAGGTPLNDRKLRAAELGAGGGVGNARAIAGLYDGVLQSLRAGKSSLWSSALVADMGKPSSIAETDATLLLPSRFGQGFMLRMDNRAEPKGRQDSLLIGDEAFGHTGMGGSVGCSVVGVVIDFLVVHVAE